VSPRGVDLLTALGLAGLLASVSLTAPRWSRVFRQPIQVASDDSGAAPPPATQESPAPEAHRTINVKLFFDAPDTPGLVLEERAVPFSNDLATQVRTLVEELVKGSQIGLLPTLSPQTKVLEVFVTARGVAYVDLSKEAQEGAGGGSDAELRSVYSVVNSVTMSLPSVSRVQILIENQPVATLAGHVDLSRPLPPDMTLLAAAALAPAASPAPEAAPSQQPPPAGGPPS
jgi:spore germination protein GerM